MNTSPGCYSPYHRSLNVTFEVHTPSLSNKHEWGSLTIVPLIPNSITRDWMSSVTAGYRPDRSTILDLIPLRRQVDTGIVGTGRSDAREASLSRGIGRRPRRCQFASTIDSGWSGTGFQSHRGPRHHWPSDNPAVLPVSHRVHHRLPQTLTGSVPAVSSSRVTFESLVNAPLHRIIRHHSRHGRHSGSAPRDRGSLSFDGGVSPTSKSVVIRS